MHGARIIDVLSEFGVIAHWTIRPDPDVGNLSFPPIIIWRYENPPEEAATFFQRAVEEHCGQIAWDFLAATPTWVLMPARLRELARSRGIGGLAAAGELMTVDPGFGRCANHDLHLLVEHLQCLLKLSKLGTLSSREAEHIPAEHGIQ